MNKKSFLVFGAGAIGTYLGASLIRGGHRVHYLEREADISRLKEGGLEITEGEKGSRIASSDFTSSLENLNLDDIDLAILALKTYHLDQLLPGLIDRKNQLPPLLCLQNGVESEARLSSSLEPAPVIAGTITSAVDRLDKGKVILQKKRGMGIAGDHPRLGEFQAVFNQAGLNCRVYASADAMKWSKLITNLLGNASSAILNLPPSTIYAHPDLYQMELDQIRECLAVMRALHIPVLNLPGVPVKVLSWIIQFLPRTISQLIVGRLIGRGRGEKMPSFHIDLHSGKGKSEVSALNGAVVRFGKKAGIETPVNEFLSNQLEAMIAGQLPLDKYQGRIENFLSDLNSFKKDYSLIE